MRAASRLLRAAEQIQQPLHDFVPRLQHRIQHALPAAWPHQAACSAGQSAAGLKAWDVAARCLHATVASTVAAAAGSSVLSGSLACRAAASLRQHAAAHGTGCTTGGSVGARCFQSHTAQRAAGAGGRSSSGSMGAHAAAAPSAAWRASGWSVTAARQAATALRPAAQALRCELRAAFLPAATFSSSQHAAAGGATAAGRASARGIPSTPAGAATAVAGVATRRTGRCLPKGAAAAAMRQQARGYNGYGRVSYSSPYASVTLNRGMDPMHMLYGLIGASLHSRLFEVQQLGSKKFRDVLDVLHAIIDSASHTCPCHVAFEHELASIRPASLPYPAAACQQLHLGCSQAEP